MTHWATESHQTRATIASGTREEEEEEEEQKEEEKEALEHHHPPDLSPHSHGDFYLSP